MVISHTVVLDDEFEFEAGLWSKFLQVKIPTSHCVDIGKSFPNLSNARVESSFDDEWSLILCFRAFTFCGHVFSPSFAVLLNSHPVDPGSLPKIGGRSRSI